MNLNSHLRQQYESLERLVAILSDEQKALSEGKVDGKLLQQLAVEKQDLFASLESLEETRKDYQKQSGYGDSSAGARKLAEMSNCREAWGMVLALTERASHLNTLNGELIQHRLEHNQHMLNIIREASGGSLYGPDGQANPKARRLSSKA